MNRFNASVTHTTWDIANIYFFALNILDTLVFKVSQPTYCKSSTLSLEKPRLQEVYSEYELEPVIKLTAALINVVYQKWGHAENRMWITECLVASLAPV